MKMEIVPSSIMNLVNPSYQIELVMKRDLDPAFVDSAIRGVKNRFPGMKFIPSGQRASSFKMDVRISVPYEQLLYAAVSRGLTTTEFLASLMSAAQESAYKSDFLFKGRRPALFVSENPTRLSSFMQCMTDGNPGSGILSFFSRNTRTFSNLGEVYLPDEVAEQLYSLDFRIIRQSGLGGACTAVNFGGRTIINCSRRTREHKFEYFFVEELRDAGLDVTVEPSGSAPQYSFVTLAYSAL